jgi:hypothetical protein
MVNSAIEFVVIPAAYVGGFTVVKRALKNYWSFVRKPIIKLHTVYESNNDSLRNVMAFLLYTISFRECSKQWNDRWRHSPNKKL